MTRPYRTTGLCAVLALCCAMPALAQQKPALAVPMVYLRQQVPQPPVLSNLDPIPEDLGIAGAEIALKDNQSTGAFMGQNFSLTVVEVPPEGDLPAAARTALAEAQLVLLEGEAEHLLTVADLPEAKGALLFNVSAGDEALRSDACRPNLLHTIPETAARTDALMQVLVARQWADLAMIVGPTPKDSVYADHLRRSAAKFGLAIAGEVPWTFDTDLRDSTMDEVPRFTQALPEHDVLLVADPTDDFGRYVLHNTWLPRPVAGTHGLHGEAWASVIEAWGAVQLQNRFEDHAARPMRSEDYAAWVAIRAIGEAVTRSGSADPAALRAYMLSEAFQLDGFKGRALTFRHWNGQMRQPIAVVNDRALVTLAPLPGFLHQRNETDSLGLDEPESRCTAFKE
ncbi:MAG TPA: ABC transporter substrate-binding protein [Gemmobacter sp.]|nr:ABC transporter substrate-binding protein [Gemmobacter sp.]